MTDPARIGVLALVEAGTPRLRLLLFTRTAVGWEADVPLPVPAEFLACVGQRVQLALLEAAERVQGILTCRWTPPPRRLVLCVRPT